MTTLKRPNSQTYITTKVFFSHKSYMVPQKEHFDVNFICGILQYRTNKMCRIRNILFLEDKFTKIRMKRKKFGLPKQFTNKLFLRGDFGFSVWRMYFLLLLYVQLY